MTKDYSLSNKNEKTLLFLLTILQIASMVDIVIMMPLGPQLIRTMGITNFEFSTTISSYTFAGAISGLIIAFFIDRYERKNFLAVISLGFMLGNFICASSNSYPWLIIGRAVTGSFAGAVSGIIWTLIGDIIPEERRGKAISQVVMSFSIASAFGVPLGIYMANIWSWRAPFWFLFISTAIIFVAILSRFPRIGNVKSRFKINHMIKSTLNYKAIKSIFFMGFVMMAGFLIIPFMSTFLVINLGLKESQLTYVYFLGGAATVFTSRVAGLFVDKYGKQKVFFWSAVLSMFTAFILTNLIELPLSIILIATTFNMIIFNARYISAVAITTAASNQNFRGSFMNLNTSVQNLSIAAVSFIGGALINELPNGKILNYHELGFLSIGIVGLCIFLSKRI